MLADVQAHFGLAKPFQRVGNFETEHQRALVREVYNVVQTSCIPSFRFDDVWWRMGCEAQPPRGQV